MLKTRESMKINNKVTDDYIVCKFGVTNDLRRIMGEHEKNIFNYQGLSITS